jgi:hypothetical protein
VYLNIAFLNRKLLLERVARDEDENIAAAERTPWDGDIISANAPIAVDHSDHNESAVDAIGAVAASIAETQRLLHAGRLSPSALLMDITDLEDCGIVDDGLIPEPIVDVAAVFPALRTLTLALSIPTPSLAAAAVHKLSELTTLTLRGCDVEDEWMGHFLAHAPPHLTSLSVLWPACGFTFALGQYDAAVHAVPQLRRFTADPNYLSQDATATAVALFPNLRELTLTADALDTAPLLARRLVANAVAGDATAEATEEGEMRPLALRHLRRLRLRLHCPTRCPVHPSLRFAIAVPTTTRRTSL